MTAREELAATGTFGDDGAKRLYRIAAAVAIGRGFKPPPGRTNWDKEAVAEVAHSFLADERTPQRLAYLVVHAVDDELFDRILHRMVLNFLRDEGRRTEVGRLMIRIREVLGKSEDFAREEDRWRLSSSPAERSAVSFADLQVAASGETRVEVPRWSSQTKRRAPAADAPSIDRLCRRVLARAAGSVRLADLAKALAPRLGLAVVPLAESLDNRDAVEQAMAPQRADAVIDSMRAAEILEVLSERERLLMATIGIPVRELRSVIGVGPSQAAELQVRLRALLRIELRDDENYESVFFHLIDQAKVWAADRTTGRGSTSEHAT